MSTKDENRLFTETPVDDIADLIAQARELNASRLLILAGRFPVCRVGENLSPPLNDERLHFSQTEALAKVLLSDQQESQLDNSGSIETSVQINGDSYQCSIFFGNGSHNFIIFLP